MACARPDDQARPGRFVGMGCKAFPLGRCLGVDDGPSRQFWKTRNKQRAENSRVEGCVVALRFLSAALSRRINTDRQGKVRGGLFWSCQCLHTCELSQLLPRIPRFRNGRHEPSCTQPEICAPSVAERRLNPALDVCLLAQSQRIDESAPDVAAHARDALEA